MIDNKSIELYNQLVKDNKYYNLFDLTILYQTNEALGCLDICLSDNNFIILASEVKRQYLKYNDVELNDELVENVYAELKEEGVI